jgi:hypothetical protein
MSIQEQLINYKNIADSFTGQHSTNTREWYYIMSNLKHNELLLSKLAANNLLKEKVNICDAGIGLGTALFDLYLQSKSIIDIEFNFFGIEKNKQYLDFLERNLIDFWNNNLRLINSDLTIQKYSNYDIVYCYLPYKDHKSLFNFYRRVSDDLLKGSLIIENSNCGKNSVLEQMPILEKIDLDGYLIFRKI